MWRYQSCLGCRGSGSTRYSGELAARAAGNTVLVEKEMATHSSVLAWRIPGTATGKPGGLPSMESHRVGHN